MKRSLLSIVLVLALTLSLFAVCVSAEEVSYSLIPVTDTWVVDKYGQECEITVTYNDDGSVNFTGTAAWPSTTAYLAEPITVDVATTTLVYDFSYETGASNISFFMEGGSFTMNSTILGDAAHDSGSGDLSAGTFKGSIALSDMINCTKFYGDEPFPAAAVVDGKITFTGLQVFSVGGADIKINEFKLVTTVEDAPETSNPPQTGDTGILVFTVLTVVAIAGCAVTVKTRG